MKRRSGPMPVSRPVAVLAPVPVYSQDQRRDRRRKRLSNIYVGDFDLAAEVRAVVSPLAQAVAAEPSPRTHAGHVEAVADAVHALVSACIGFIAERDGMAKVRHLDDRPGDRTRALKTLADMADRPPAPVITDDDLASGRWSTVLVKLAQPYSTGMADVLAAALPPDAPELKGAPSISERLESELRDLDRAARLLSERVRRAAFYRRECPTPPPVDRKTQEAHATLAALGVAAP